MYILNVLALFIAICAVALADVAFKKASIGNTFYQTLLNGWTMVGIALYLFQIVFFIYLFSKRETLIHIGTYQTVLYAIITISSGALLFGERVSTTQFFGIAIAVFGVLIAQR